MTSGHTSHSTQVGPRTATLHFRRGFVDIAEGQVHFREAGAARATERPLVLLHASPGSAKMLEPLACALGVRRRVVALDTLGNGDSCAPLNGESDLHYFAGAHVRALTALGIDSFDLYGTHTGANLACEIAIAHPTRVRSLILDGIGLYDEALQSELIAHHVPHVCIDRIGSQFGQVWHFVRDAYLFWPWFRTNATNRRSGGLPNPDVLHDKVVEVLKAARTFHIPYRAALAYPKEQRLPLVRVPTLVTCARDDVLFAYFAHVGKLVPEARHQVNAGVGTDAALRETAALFESFLEACG